MIWLSPRRRPQPRQRRGRAKARDAAEQGVDIDVVDPAIARVGPRRGGDLARRIIGEVQRQVVRRARQVLGQLLQPAHGIIAVVRNRPVAARQAGAPPVGVVGGGRPVLADMGHARERVVIVGDVERVRPGQARAPARRVVLIAHRAVRGRLARQMAQAVPDMGDRLGSVAHGEQLVEQIGNNHNKYTFRKYFMTLSQQPHTFFH